MQRSVFSSHALTCTPTQHSIRHGVDCLILTHDALVELFRLRTNSSTGGRCKRDKQAHTGM